MPARRSAWRKTAIILAAAATLLTGAAVTSTTVAQNDIVGEWDHFTNCFDFMINDASRHRRNCQPNRGYQPFSTQSLSTPVSASPAPARS